MFTNPYRQIERLKTENEKLKHKINDLVAENNELNLAATELEDKLQFEKEHTQNILGNYKNLEKQWTESIEAARLAKIRYDRLYKKCCKLKRKQK